ncbi:MAG: hypothetical protein IKW89_00610 [Bacteroidales bacterium]|nr:hypothetical protein [Bacteroidales bacterium]
MRIERIPGRHQAFKEITRLRKGSFVTRLFAGIMARLSGFRIFLRYKLFRPALPDPLPVEGDYVLSMTSFPKRMRYLWMVIDMLMRQETRPSAIYLCLYKGDFPDGKLPESLEPYLERGLQVLWAGQDLKPHLKYQLSFKEEASGRKRNVITVDDDLFYPTWMVSRLARLHSEFPDAVCADITRRINGPHYSDWAFEMAAHAPDKDLLALGAGGVLYPYSFYKSECLFDTDSILKTCLKADDLWLKRCENLVGIGVATGDFFAVPAELPSSQTVSLSSSNVDLGKNDVAWAALQRLDS